MTYPQFMFMLVLPFVFMPSILAAAAHANEREKGTVFWALLYLFLSLLLGLGAVLLTFHVYR